MQVMNYQLSRLTAKIGAVLDCPTEFKIDDSAYACKVTLQLAGCSSEIMYSYDHVLKGCKLQVECIFKINL